MEQKNIQIGGIYILRFGCAVLEVRPDDWYFNNEWSPGLLDTVSYAETHNVPYGTPIAPEHQAEATRIRLLQVERMNFRKKHGRSIPQDTVLLLVSKGVVPANSKAGRPRTALFQFLVAERPAWFFFTERGCIHSFMETFKFVKASKRKKP